MKYFKVQYTSDNKDYETLTNAENKQQATNRVWDDLMKNKDLVYVEIKQVMEV